MKAKYGKISIGCFIVWCLSVGLTVSICYLTYNQGYQRGFLNLLVMFPVEISGIVTFCGPYLGILLGFVGVRKKESPKWYSIVGFLLNVGALPVLLYVLYRSGALY